MKWKKCVTIFWCQIIVRYGQGLPDYINSDKEKLYKVMVFSAKISSDMDKLSKVIVRYDQVIQSYGQIWTWPCDTVWEL